MLLAYFARRCELPGRLEASVNDSDTAVSSLVTIPHTCLPAPASMDADSCLLLRLLRWGLAHISIWQTDLSSAIAGTLQELAAFYKKNGQRARISTADGSHLLEKLKAAKSLLPAS